MSNEPDDIRSYDNDPRSPHYEAPPCEHCGQGFDDCDCCDDCEHPQDKCECDKND